MNETLIGAAQADPPATPEASDVPASSRISASAARRLVVVAALVIGAVSFTAVARAGTLDDAAISFTFAEALAQGHPPGTFAGTRPVVEAYSNPSWVLLLAAGVRLGLTVETAAFVLALGFLLGALLLVARVTIRAGTTHPPWSALIAAVSVGVVFWSASGLENALFAFLLMAAATALIAEERRHLHGWRTLGSAAAVVALALTRPDGLVFVGVGLLARLVTLWAGRSEPAERRRAAWTLLLWCAAVALGLLPFFLWRHATFGVVWPNSVYAKVSEASVPSRLGALLTPGAEAHEYVVQYLLGQGALLVLPFVVLGAWAVRRRPERWIVAMAAASLLLPLSQPDWMRQSRFFSGFAVLSAPLVQLGAERLGAWGRRTDRRSITSVFTVLMVLTFVVLNVNIVEHEATSEMSSQVTVALIHSLHQPFEDDMKRFGLRDPLVMVPDLGWPSWQAHWEVLDSVGLFDTQVAHSDWRPDALQAYAFDEERPLLLHTHHYLGARWGLDMNVLRREGYLPLRLQQADPLIGQFVRRDVVVRKLTGERNDALDDAGRWRLDHLAVPTVAEPGGDVAVEAVVATTDPEPVEIEVTAPTLGRSVREPVGFGVAGASDLRSGEGLRVRARLPLPNGIAPGTHPLEVRLLRQDGSSAGPAVTTELRVEAPDRALEVPPWTPDAVGAPGGPGPDAFQDLALANPARAAAVWSADDALVARARGDLRAAIERSAATDPVRAADRAGELNRWRAGRPADTAERSLARTLDDLAATSSPEQARWLLVAGVRLDPQDASRALRLAALRVQVSSGRATTGPR